MIYGIDLGTTYSAIGYGDELYSGLVDSAVDITTQKNALSSQVGKNIVASYKVDMTTGESGNVSRRCSSITLRTLVDMANSSTDKDVQDVVVSVPAKFSVTQRNAVWQSIVEAGLNPRGIINEPTAAAIYACTNNKDLIIVYDLGGGTFDITILDSRAGDYYIVASDGNSHLAGDNLDRAIAEEAMRVSKVPIRLKTLENRQRLYKLCQSAKEQLCSLGQASYIDFPELGIHYRLELDFYKSLMRKVFKPTLDLTVEMLKENTMPTDTPKLLFVGGSTADPYLREWISAELGLPIFTTDCNPSFLVAKGVALYAKMLEDGRAEREVNDVTARISVEESTGMTETIIEANSIIPISESKIFTNDYADDKIDINLFQGDAILASENDYIGTLRYPFGRMLKPNEGRLEVTVKVDRNGIITLECMDLTTCEVREVKLRMYNYDSNKCETRVD